MNKLKIELTDFDALAKVSSEMLSILLRVFPRVNTDNTELNLEYPVRWKIRVENYDFEWVISEMGSITLRLGEHARFRRNPPPIFYLSLGKYEEVGFLWEDPEGNPIHLTEKVLEELVSEKIHLFIKSETSSQ
jgi:hypothetical protein